MSRSYKKHPITGFACAESEKDDKVRAHKKFRRLQNIRLKEIEKIPIPQTSEDIEPLGEIGWDVGFVIDEKLPIDLNEVSEIYSFAKDGKQYVTGKERKKALRK